MTNKPKTRLRPLRADRPERLASPPFPLHGALKLPTARVDSYNLDITYRGKRLAACTNKRALKAIVVLHNDAVVQGLSEIPFLGSCRRWGVFTVGTGLGNARFSLVG
jgi:hypothetical protein